MRNGGNIGNLIDRETSISKDTEDGVAAGARAFDEDRKGGHAFFFGFFDGFLDSSGRCKWSGLTGTFETDGAGVGPGDHIAAFISEGDQGVIEGGFDIEATIGHRGEVTLGFLGSGGFSSHGYLVAVSSF